MTSINFNQSLNLEPRSKDSSKKVIALKNFKFSKKQQSQSQNPQASLPKPPLHKKNFNNESTTETFGNGSTAEALLKMADERLATIEQELSQTRSASKKSVQTLDGKIKKVILKDPSKKSEIQTNFNLSFNNSFNTSINHNTNNGSAQPPHMIAFSSSNHQTNTTQSPIKTSNNDDIQQTPPNYQGFFTADAVYLEK